MGVCDSPQGLSGSGRSQHGTSSLEFLSWLQWSLLLAAVCAPRASAVHGTFEWPIPPGAACWVAFFSWNSVKILFIFIY